MTEAKTPGYHTLNEVEDILEKVEVEQFGHGNRIDALEDLAPRVQKLETQLQNLHDVLDIFASDIREAADQLAASTERQSTRLTVRGLARIKGSTQ